VSSIFEKIYHNYLDEIKKYDLESLSKRIGAEWNGKYLKLYLFSQPFYISKEGIFNDYGKRPSHSETVVLAKYVIGYPQKKITARWEWFHYRDFKDSAPLLDAFYNNVEKRLAQHFKERIQTLIESCEKLNGIPYDKEWGYDVSFLFNALPDIPMLLLFNDADETFPPYCNILFKSTIKYYLDMESVAILGLILADYLLSQQESLQ